MNRFGNDADRTAEDTREQFQYDQQAVGQDRKPGSGCLLIPHHLIPAKIPALSTLSKDFSDKLLPGFQAFYFS
jgi:hypothetical protein